jgi:hypothetical protein
MQKLFIMKMQVSFFSAKPKQKEKREGDLPDLIS